jgi:hypothetical protein
VDDARRWQQSGQGPETFAGLVLDHDHAGGRYIAGFSPVTGAPTCA